MEEALEIEVRDAANNDKPAVVALWQACGLVSDLNEPGTDFLLALANPTSTVIVGVDGQAIIGTVMVGHDGHRGYLHYVSVAPSRRFSGVGRLMVDAAERWLRARHIRKVHISILHDNITTRKFYEKLGYAEPAAILMRKWLET